MDCEDRWQLVDFGVVQYLCDVVTGTFTRIYGAGQALFNDGPFELAFIHERPVVLGPGDDETRSLHCMDEPQYQVPLITRVVPASADEEDDYTVTSASDPTAPPQLLSDLQARRSDFALDIDTVVGPFKAEWAVFSAPRISGGKPVSVYVSFTWLLAFLYPGKDCKTYLCS